MAELTQAEVDKFLAAQESEKKKPKATQIKREEFVPTEEEEEEVGKHFKKTTPRVLTPDEVRGGPASEPSTEQGESDDAPAGQWPDHETITIAREKHVSDWEEGIHEVTIERTFTGPGKDTFHRDENGEPKDITLLHVGFIADNGLRVQKRMTMSLHEKSNLGKLTTAIFGAPPDSISTDDLVGKKVRVVIENQVNKNGHEWATIVQFLASTKFKSGGGV
jgi:hypothetical protein